MHARTAELLSHLETHRAKLRAAVGSASADRCEQLPAAGSWSVAGILEHLAIVEKQIAAILKRGLRAALASGPLPEDRQLAAVLPTLDTARLLDRQQPLQAGAGVRPTGIGIDEAWQALAASRAALREVMLLADGLATEGIRAPHPFLGELTFHQWCAFVGFHEARHADQVRATLSAVP